MNRTFTIDEDIIRRLVLNRDRDDRQHERSRRVRVSSRRGRGLAGPAHESAWIALRSR